MLRPRKPARGLGKLRLPLRGILLGSLVLLSIASSLWTLRRALGADRAPDLMNGAQMLRSLAPNTCACGACRIAVTALTCVLGAWVKHRMVRKALWACTKPAAPRRQCLLWVLAIHLLLLHSNLYWAGNAPA